MNNRTYRYFKGPVLYPFGYGLSYSGFEYDQLKLPSGLKPRQSLPVSVRVSNSGKMDGDEVVELYVSGQDQSTRSPIRALKGFKRIS